MIRHKLLRFYYCVDQFLLYDSHSLLYHRYRRLSHLLSSPEPRPINALYSYKGIFTFILRFYLGSPSDLYFLQVRLNFLHNASETLTGFWITKINLLDNSLFRFVCGFPFILIRFVVCFIILLHKVLYIWVTLFAIINYLDPLLIFK